VDDGERPECDSKRISFDNLAEYENKHVADDACRDQCIKDVTKCENGTYFVFSSVTQ
jgi:hypothetical protein